MDRTSCSLLRLFTWFARTTILDLGHLAGCICGFDAGERIMADFSVNNLYHQYNMPHLNFNCSVLLAPQHLLDCLGN